MRKRTILFVLLGVCVGGQVESKANTVLFAVLPSTGFDSDPSGGGAHLLGSGTVSASFDLTVTPEPASLWLGGLGLALFAWGLRRRDAGNRSQPRA